MLYSADARSEAIQQGSLGMANGSAIGWQLAQLTKLVALVRMRDLLSTF